MTALDTRSALFSAGSIAQLLAIAGAMLRLNTSLPSKLGNPCRQSLQQGFGELAFDCR
jgi:hypothetical protein